MRRAADRRFGAARAAAAGRFGRALWILGAACLPLAATAQIYVCKDASGRTLTSDRPIPECANRSMRELDRSGLVRREIAAPLTAQQKQERDQERERQRQENIALEEQRLYDRALMTRYRNEGDIATARQRALDLLGEQMRIDTNALARETRELKAAQSRVVAGTRKLIAEDERRLDESTRRVESRLDAIEQRTAEIARTNTKFDKALQRFRELSAATGAGSNQR